MILVQLTKDDYDSISRLLVREMRYFEGRACVPDAAQMWQDISSRFNPIAASESTVLWSPTCPCGTEMSLEENIPDQAGETIVVWLCDNCGVLIEFHIYPKEE